jgi:hypothetical protein
VSGRMTDERFEAHKALKRWRSRERSPEIMDASAEVITSAPRAWGLRPSASL